MKTTIFEGLVLLCWIGGMVSLWISTPVIVSLFWSVPAGFAAGEIIGNFLIKFIK